MFCPNCGNPNIEGAKFCRACGGDLESIGLAMKNKLAAPPDWVELYGDSKSSVAVGAIMTGATLLILFGPLLMFWRMMPWLPIWSVFFGWLFVWGTLKFAGSVGSLIKAKTMLRSLNPEALPGGEYYRLHETPAKAQLPDARPNSVYETDELRVPHSVTDHTTKFLNKK